MNVSQAHDFLSTLVRMGLGDLQMYSEYEKVEGMRAGGAEESRDGSQLELEVGEPFVYVRLGH